MDWGGYFFLLVKIPIRVKITRVYANRSLYVTYAAASVIIVIIRSHPLQFNLQGAKRFRPPGEKVLPC